MKKRLVLGSRWRSGNSVCSKEDIKYLSQLIVCAVQVRTQVLKFDKIYKSMYLICKYLYCIRRRDAHDG
jgi:hypothetical protein